jgi:UDP-N-acetylmuramate dehydrogenase
MQLRENQPLAPFTTFGIGGPARWFVEAASEEEVVEATAWAQEHGASLFVLGGGSNLLVSDAGFNGLILRVALRGISFAESRQETGQQAQRVYQAAAGEDWDNFVERTIQEGCAGIECLAGIPGTVGGTPVQNVGAYGQEVAPVIDCVRAFDLAERVFVEFSVAECGFAYRRSRFNSTDRGRYIVARVDYRLQPGGAPTLRYADLQRAVEASRSGRREPSLAEVAVAVRRIRLSKGMLLVDGDPDCRSAGSFFKNPVISEELFKEIAARCALKELPRYPAGSGLENAGLVKIPAAWLIEQAGFSKGYALGSAAISSRHTLALINRGGATAHEILALANRIAGEVEACFGIRLEMEPVLMGFEPPQ